MNVDGYVDIFDATLVGTCMMVPAGSDPRCTRADVEADGDIDVDDFIAVQTHFGTVLFNTTPNAYAPASIHLGRGGVIYLHAPNQNMIHRWSLTTRRPLAPIQIGVSSRVVTYASDTDRLYVAYSDRRITRIDASFPVAETRFATLPGAPLELISADPWLIAADASGGVSHHTFAPDGRRVSTRTNVFESRLGTWSAANRRLYYQQDPGYYQRIRWESIDTSGQILPGGDTPYPRIYEYALPIRVSGDGSRLLLGSSDIYDAVSLEILDALPNRPVDAVWIEGRELLTLEELEGGGGQLVHWDRDLRPYSLQRYPGRPLRVFAWEGGYAVVTRAAGQPTVHTYVPSDDADGDGVTNAADALPLDPAASQDRDGDGAPDVWNPGRGAADSSEGLALDAFPDDSACQIAAHARHGQPGVCDIAQAIPPYTPARIEFDAAGTIYLLSPEHDRVFRWSLVEDDHLNPIDVGNGAQQMAYSAENQSLYLGYAGGAITRVDLRAATLHEAPFETTPGAITGLEAIGRFAFVADTSEDDTRYSTYAPNGTRLSLRTFGNASKTFSWSPVNRRIYHTTDDYSPNDLQWNAIDSLGRLAGSQQSPDRGDHPIQHPLRVSRDASSLLIGTGDIYHGTDLTIVRSLPRAISEAHWLPDGTLLTIRDGGNGHTLIEQRGTDLLARTSSYLPGTPLRVLEAAGEIAVITLVNGRPVVHGYTPSDDGDGDGMSDAQDAFPLDPAASQDRDHDGAPDGWNQSYGPEDSLDGLALDAFPDDHACQLPEHGIGGACDFPNVLPASIDQPFCDIDTALPAATSGSVELGGAHDFVPLCDGWLLIGETERGRLEGRIAVRNVVNGRTGAVFRLPSGPGDLELDEAAKRLYVALPEQLALAVLDLLTGSVRVIPVGEKIASLSLGSGGDVFAVADAWPEDRLYWLPAGGSAVVGGWVVKGQTVRWSPRHGELVVALAGYSYGAWLYRYAFDPATGPSLLQSQYAGDSRGYDLAVSGDGEHLVFPVGSGNGRGYSFDMYDYIPNDLSSRRGEWSLNVVIRAVAFDRASERLLGVDGNGGTRLRIFDVASFAQLDILPLPLCSWQPVFSVAFSRGGSLAFAKQACGPLDAAARYFWFATD